MINPYTIILCVFIGAGVGATLWGWNIIRNARKTQAWPCVPGTIVESLAFSKHDAHLPHITYRYRVNEQSITNTLTIPGGVTPSEEFAKSYAKKFPTGSDVTVYFNPDDPQQATLEPGLANGDWLIFALGFGTTLFGVVLLLLGDD